ncbi:MAG TPA: toll/interleukin-1 receptor domain-containing protein [Acidobacteriaceae bacterium]
MPTGAGTRPKAKLFLSCAAADEEVGGRIAERLRADFQVFYWQEPNRGGWFIELIEKSINSADVFLVLLSPSSLASYWCIQERMLALQREAQLKRADPSATFIHVANVADMLPTDAGFLSAYNWLSVTNTEDERHTLARLSELSTTRQPDTPGAEQVRSSPEDFDVQVEPMGPTVGNDLAFRNRVDELNPVLNGLTNSAGPHFWHVVAPPQLGKTWFLEHISTHVRLRTPDLWVVRLVDLRQQPPDVRDDAAALLALLFDHEPTAEAGKEMREIAQHIGRSGNPHLCMVDSAELLSREAADALRSYLKEVGDYVRLMGSKKLRLAFIVASRDDGWKGIVPQRLAPLPLTEFTSDVVQQALHDLSEEMGRGFSADWLRENALRVHRVTEGLPALLVKCLQWIQREHWLELERLEDQERFEELLVPYVERGLLTSASLLPGGRGRAQKQLRALIEAYRVLVPYRLFTQSHLRHYKDTNGRFDDALDAAKWSITDLWAAISATTLLKRPSNELWKEVHPAIRRLLYRYFYRSKEDRAAVHGEARQFMALWSDKQVGTEQCVGLVECLWHEANQFLSDPLQMEEKLAKSARSLSSALSESTAYVLDELRAFATNRMRDDVELGELIGDRLLNRLIEIVRNPEGP